MNVQRKYKNIVWDWNGTLLNDLDAGVSTLNKMLERRGLPEVTKEGYREIFGFPVAPFYQKLGFDMEGEGLHRVSVEFVETYADFSHSLSLHDGVYDVLNQLKDNGFNQYILSALQEEVLQRLVADFRIADCFEAVCGSDNIYAAGKVDRGRRMLERYRFQPFETLMIGDTLHDAEVAEAMGFDCMLFARGHNSTERLRSKADVLESMELLLEVLS